MMKFNKLNRRNLLSLAGGAAASNALLPFIPRLEAAEADLGAPIRRYAYWFEFTMPEKKFVNENFQNDYGAVNFKNGYSALNDSAIADKVMFLRNVRRPSSDGGDGPHPSGVAGISGWKGHPGRYNNNATSLDQMLAKHFSGKTAVTDIRAGYQNDGKDGDYDRSTSVVNGTIKPRYQSPIALFDDLFKGFSGGGNVGGQRPSDVLRQRKSLLDHMNGTINKLSRQVSHFDQQKIEAHLTALRDTEQKLENLLDSSSMSTCEAMQRPSTGNNAQPNDVYPIYSRMMASALACDMTRVAGAHYGSSACRINYQFLNSYKGGGNFHNATHGKHSGPAYIRDVLKFRAEQVAYFLKQLAAIREPDGSTLLDNTIFLWTTDLMRNHDNKGDMHCVMAGGTGRFKKQGQMVNANGSTHADVMTSIAHFCGLEINKFGDPRYCNGTLPNALFS